MALVYSLEYHDNEHDEDIGMFCTIAGSCPKCKEKGGENSLIYDRFFKKSKSITHIRMICMVCKETTSLRWKQ